jgi:hypothetical protein
MSLEQAKGFVSWQFWDKDLIKAGNSIRKSLSNVIFKVGKCASILIILLMVDQLVKT